MKKSIKVLIAFITSLVLVTIINVNAATGYTYDHNGDPIYSTTGLVITTPKTAEDLGINSGDFSSPEDLFVYTDENGVTTIYIIDSGSNKIFMLDGNYNKVDSIDSVIMNVDDFTDEQLQAIKSNGNWVISRQVITIPADMEDIYLVFNEETKGKTPLKYELYNTPTAYKITWESSDENVVVYNIDGINESLVATGEGVATITGKVIDETLDDDGKPLGTTVGEVSIDVTVTAEEPTDVPIPEKNNGFTLDEIRNLPNGKVEIKFAGLSGIYRAVTSIGGVEEDLIYISDRKNNQIIVIDSLTNEVVKFVTVPDDVSFEGKSFQPKEIVTDLKGRMYVIAENVYEGIIQFSYEGQFDRFTGVNYVKLSPWEIFWRNFSTEAQLAQQESIINTSFTGMTVDEKGFIYATSYALTDEDDLVTDDKNMIKRINPSGKDVLRRNGYQPPMGDVEYVAASTDIIIRGPSRFTGITVNEYGVYTALDLKMGKLFTYDREGNLLYISGESYISGGGNASQINTLSNPVAISYYGENILVLDKNQKALLIFEPTAIGSLINQAVALEFEGDKIGAADVWEQVVKQNANYEYAYVGIGKKYMELEDYEKAMENFEFGEDRDLYSRAFKLQRDSKVRKYFAPVMGLIVVLLIARFVYKFIKKRNLPKVEDTGTGDE